MSALFGSVAMAGLEASALGLPFCQIPAGVYEVGDAEIASNPPRHVESDVFELAETPTTNQQLADGLKQLQGKNAVLMYEEHGAARKRHWTIVARGTREEINNIRLGELMDVVPAHVRDKRVSEFSIQGALGMFDLIGIVPVLLGPWLVERSHGRREPTLVNFFESTAIAALFGFFLPTKERWEIAAGDLRDKRYLDERELRRVAHFQPEGAMADVGTKEPNQYGLRDMLGNVWVWMANRIAENSKRRVIAGGCWMDGPELVRATKFGSAPPLYWGEPGVAAIGCRFARQKSSG